MRHRLRVIFSRAVPGSQSHRAECPSLGQCVRALTLPCGYHGKEWKHRLPLGLVWPRSSPNLHLSLIGYTVLSVLRGWSCFFVIFKMRKYSSFVFFQELLTPLLLRRQYLTFNQKMKISTATFLHAGPILFFLVDMTHSCRRSLHFLLCRLLLRTGCLFIWLLRW